jgi:dolichol-phosphate mannosyltransferase
MEQPNFRLLIVDDQSPTARVVSRISLRGAFRPIRVLHRTGHRGLGRSYVDGLGEALREPVDVICQMDADLSHDRGSFR